MINNKNYIYKHLKNAKKGFLFLALILVIFFILEVLLKQKDNFNKSNLNIFYDSNKTIIIKKSQQNLQDTNITQKNSIMLIPKIPIKE